jgi:hypothetical protein
MLDAAVGMGSGSELSTPVDLLRSAERLRVSDGALVPVLELGVRPCLVVLLSQLGDFDAVEYGQCLAGYLAGEGVAGQGGVDVRAVAIGDRAGGQRFCDYTGFPAELLLVDPMAELHRRLGLYAGLTIAWPGLSVQQRAWANLMLMCAGIGSPGTLGEVLRGYRGDRRSPQLIGPEEVVKAGPLPPLTGAMFDVLGRGFQRPFELATLRLRNMTEVLSHWGDYVPDAAYLTQRGGTFLVDPSGELRYEHRDRGILGFSATMANPLAFLAERLGPNGSGPDA